jgi:hypothetical protein
MADNVTVDNGTLTDYVVSADEGAGGQVQRVKLAYSADGSEVHVPADADGLLVNLGANNDVTVSGVSTAANQATEIGHLAEIEALLGGIDTKVSTIANAVSGTEMQVDVLTMPTVAVTGTFWQATQPVSGTVTANAGTGTFTVAGAVTNTVLSVVGGGTEATAQRVTLASDSTGVLSVDDNGSTLSVDDGGGSLTVDGTVAVSGTVTVASHAVTNAGTFVTQENGAALTSLQLLDDSIVADDAAFTPGTTKVSMAGFEYDDTTPDSVNEGDAGAARMSANRNQYVQIRDNAGNERGLNVAADGSIAVTVATIPSHAVTNAGTFVVQESGAALTALQAMDDWDESDRAKVNPIVGQAGIAAGAGAVGVTVPRVTLASDDPAVVALQLLDNAIAGSEMQVDVVTSALPSGASTAANQTTIIGHVDGIETLLGTIDADTGGIATSAATIAGAVSGSEMQVDVLSVIPGTGTSALGKAVDSAAGGTDTGIAVLAVRDDTLSALTPIDGDYTPLRVSSTGALHVTGGGGGTQYNVDGASTGTDTGTLALAIRDDALTTLTPIDGDYVGLRTNSVGALQVNLGTALDSTIDSISALGEIAHDSDGTASPPLLVGGYASAAAPTNVSADGDAVRAWHLLNGAQVNALVSGSTLIGVGNGTAATALRVTLPTDGTGVVVLGAGTAGIGKLTANSGVDIGDVDVTSMPGTGVEDAGETAGGTLLMAGTVRRDTPAASAGTTGDNATLNTDSNGRVWTNGGTTTLANGQVAPTNSAGTVVAARTGRQRLTLVNIGTITVYVGIATVTTANGVPIYPGGSMTLENSALVQGITASGTGAIAYIEEYA